MGEGFPQPLCWTFIWSFSLFLFSYLENRGDDLWASSLDGDGAQSREGASDLCCWAAAALLSALVSASLLCFLLPSSPHEEKLNLKDRKIFLCSLPGSQLVFIPGSNVSWFHRCFHLPLNVRHVFSLLKHLKSIFGCSGSRSAPTEIQGTGKTTEV